MRALIRVHYFNDQHVHRIGIRDAHASYIYIYIYIYGWIGRDRYYEYNEYVYTVYLQSVFIIAYEKSFLGQSKASPPNVFWSTKHVFRYEMLFF
jgi:hypothetical protein